MTRKLDWKRNLLTKPQKTLAGAKATLSKVPFYTILVSKIQMHDYIEQ